MAAMAVTDANDIAPPRSRLRLPARLRRWLTGEHASAQRMAGMAFLIRVAGAAIVFASQVLLARWMGSFEFGIYVYAWTWLLLVGDLIHLGLPVSAQRAIPQYTEGQDFDRLRGFLFGSRWMVFGIGTAAAVAGAAVVHALTPVLDRPTVLPLYLACVALPFYTLSNLLDGLARCYNAVHTALLPPFVLRPLLLIAVMALCHAAGLVTDATTAMAAFAFATWSATALQLVMLERRLRASVPAGPHRYDAVGWLSSSLPIVAMWAFYTVLTYSDVLVLRQFGTPEDVAHYYAAAKILALAAFIHFAVAAAVAHRFATYQAAGDHVALTSFAATTVRWTFWPSLLAIVLILALGRPILWLFGPSFVAAYPLMFVVALGLIARAAVGPAERVLNMLGAQRLCALVYGVALAVNLAAAFLLAPLLGAMGVAIAMSCAIVAESAMLFAIAKRRLGLHLFIWQPRGQAG
jgi:O-antigen/teichoic acid export membrane protein